jgi:molybdopterin-containing oxidoreductase family iron-sulfur binding subunit
MPSLTGQDTGLAYWRSLDELADTPEFRRFVEAEFPGLATGMLDSASRRRFLKLMGASLALAGLTGCRWPTERIAPYANRPAGRTPGVPVQYATAMELGGVAAGLLVTSYDGRPIKIEGNPSHPTNRGAADAFSQAAILELYDPDRSTVPIQREGGQWFRRTWDEVAAFCGRHFEDLRPSGGAGLRILSEASSSSSLADMRARLLEAFPQAEWVEYEPVSFDNERAGTAMAFGSPYRIQYALDRADTVVCLDADLLMTHPAAVRHARDFADGRRVNERGRRSQDGRPMNRLYVLESHHTVTGSAADHRWAVRSAAIPAVADQLAARLAELGVHVPHLGAEVLGAAAELKGAAPPGREAVAAMAGELAASRGRGLVAAGPQQPPEVHALVCAVNEALGHVGRTVTYTAASDPGRPTHTEAIRNLAADMRAGKVNTLLILGGNPVYDAPADLGFGELLSSVETAIHLSLYRNETSRACHWHLPRAHFLESWGDARAYDGTLSIVQPLIEPFYGGRTPIEVLAWVLREKPENGYEIVRRTMRRMHSGPDFEHFWKQSLHDGVVPGTTWPAEAPRVRAGQWAERFAGQVAAPAEAGAGNPEIVFRPDTHVYDGRFANNGWLQELPEPISKLTWDNAAILGPATAGALGARTGDLLRLSRGTRELEIAAFVLPGVAEGSVTLTLGYGRSAAGRVGSGTGFNTYVLRTSEAMHTASGVAIARTGRRYQLAVTQDHHAIESEVGKKAKRERLHMLVREATVDEYVERPDFPKHAVHMPPLVSPWKEKEYTGHRWAMSIDLNACIGCGACVTACQAENNIPVVGKDEVDRGREMHWIRVDRYFKGPPEAPQVSHQPVTCHQCENAPCEQVCPVAATMHSSEGLNDMVYNRCIGTRYCSNNCPYKVRRFNWFNNHKDLAEIEKMRFNPEVTVRSRGVMEKCTYCVQRISAAKIAAKNERRPIADGEITPACAQTCPTQAIVFGDLSDPGSRVSRSHGQGRSYALLAELNVKPRTKYLAKLRNPAEGLDYAPGAGYGNPH